MEHAAKHAAPEETPVKNKWYSSTAFIVLMALIVGLLLRFFVVEFVRVDGPSMQPTLESGEVVCIEKVSKAFSDPQRYDVVICHFDETSTNYVKRIIGLPGETVSVVGGKPYINGEPLDDDIYGTGLKPVDMEPVTIPEDCVFVMGDNRANSKDSVVVGPIQKSRIVGRVMFIVWPFDQIGGL